jgi:hypothetical protein
MLRLREWFVRLLGTIRPRRRDRELEEELRHHLALAAEDEHRRGLPDDVARRAARLRAGDLTQTMETLRDQRGLPWLEDLGRDFRYALRLASRQPRFSLMIVATTALAIGLSTALFSVVDATLLRPLPYQHSEELMDGKVRLEIQEPHWVFYGVAISDLRRWRGSKAIAGAAGWRHGPDIVLAGAVPVRATARDIT